jgi:hypothetical protein
MIVTIYLPLVAAYWGTLLAHCLVLECVFSALTGRFAFYRKIRNADLEQKFGDRIQRLEFPCFAFGSL